MSVVTDRLKGNPAALPQRVSAYEPDIVAAQDYYPFGQVMRGRNFPTLLGKSNFPTKYRYGFNDKEADADGEIQNLTTYDYGFRIYNPGIARFLSVDPLTSSYPSWSPYPFAMNRPIDGIDLDGLEYVNSTTGEYDPYPNGAYHGDANDDFYDTKAKNHQNHQQDLIDKGFLPSAPLVTITDERPAPAKVDPSTIQSTPNGIYFSSTSGISHYFNDNTSIANRTTYLWSGEKWDLIRSEQQQYKTISLLLMLSSMLWLILQSGYISVRFRNFTWYFNRVPCFLYCR
ncbi:MAG: hypothetical protein IPM86_02015 [Saprospiraceae bacterium]|nr:hypothetical protein [Saprospiraceae bacterium]